MGRGRGRGARALSVYRAGDLAAWGRRRAAGNGAWLAPCAGGVAMRQCARQSGAAHVQRLFLPGGGARTQGMGAACCVRGVAREGASTCSRRMSSCHAMRLARIGCLGRLALQQQRRAPRIETTRWVVVAAQDEPFPSPPQAACSAQARPPTSCSFPGAPLPACAAPWCTGLADIVHLLIRDIVCTKWTQAHAPPLAAMGSLTRRGSGRLEAAMSRPIDMTSRRRLIAASYRHGAHAWAGSTVPLEPRLSFRSGVVHSPLLPLLGALALVGKALLVARGVTQYAPLLHLAHRNARVGRLLLLSAATFKWD